MSANEAGQQLKFSPFQGLGEILSDLPPTTQERPPPAPQGTVPEDDLLLKECLAPRFQEQAQTELRRCMAEVRELERENRWADILSLFHPLEDKAPAIVDAGMDLDLRLEVVFALGQAGRFEEALTCLSPALRDHPEHFLAHNAAAFNAYQSLLKHRERKVRFLPEERRERIRFAHDHFKRCQEIRHDSVTSFYRQGMLYKEVENKTIKAARCFERAVSNWEALSAEQQERRHQERPKYVRSLFHLASCHLAHGEPHRALDMMKRLFREDEQRAFISPVHRHFAMAKTLHALGRFAEALEHLETAGHAAARQEPTDYVWELAARSALALKDPKRGMNYLARIPERARRHYVRWTEADLLCALERTDEAEQVLTRSAERDRRSRHRALMRLARIQYRKGLVERSLEYAVAANRFCKDTYGSENHEALFWKAGCLLRLGRNEEAEETLQTLETLNPDYPRLNRLRERIRGAASQEPPHGSKA